MADKVLEFFFDVGSPATYLAWTQLPALASEEGAQLVHRPMLLGGVFKATGNVSPVTIPAKGAYTLKDFARFARRYGVPLRHNPFFPINTLLLMRAIASAQLHMPQRFLALTGLVFDAMWVQGLDMNDPAVVGAVLERGGFVAQDVLALAQDAQAKEALRHNTEEAVRRGAFGAPTFFVGDEMFFGQDRLDFVREALRAAG